MNDPKIITAIIAAGTSLLVAIISQVLIGRREARTAREEERKMVQLEYLNPLRLYLIENHFRLSEIHRIVEEKGKCEFLLFIENASELSRKDGNWFNGNGCYLISSCYLTACLFSCFDRVRRGVPFLKLSRHEDTIILALTTKVALGFLRHLGVFYVTQFSIGNDMYNSEEERLLSYREFCELVSKEENIPWFSRLFEYYILTGKGEHPERVAEALNAMKELSAFLDKSVGGGESLEERYRAEGVKAL